ncbi:MAG: hypothetical protein AB7T48_00480 [Solirubrobacterales bacterium]
MVDRLRVLLEEPLDPRVGRAVVALASSILLGLAALFILAAREPDPSIRAEAPSAAPSSPGAPAAGFEPPPVEESRPPRHLRQDPQDEKGSPAARRAARALASHRALQHVPYRDGPVTIALVGARGSRAILHVSAPTGAAARRGWRRFLGRFRDPGRAYVPIFRTGGRDG